MSDEFEAHDLNIEDNSEIVRLAKAQQVDLVVVGPEVPLCNGAVDALNEAGILAYGPIGAGRVSKEARRTPRTFSTNTASPPRPTEISVRSNPPRPSRKARPAGCGQGQRAGRRQGVLICQTLEEAEEAVLDMLAGESFGDSGKEVVIEEFLEGEEASLHLICSGESFVAMPMSQDHKKVGEGDTGLNTGGMGAYAPTQLVTPEMLAEYEQSIVRPTLAGLKSEGVDFRGTLYVGLMLTSEGAKVLEFNVRFGDPETQVILPLLADDLVPLLLQSARGEDMPEKVAFKNESSMVVVLTSAGYPESYPKGETIRIAEEIPRGSEVIHAGTQKNQAGEIVAPWACLGRGDTLALAREAYALCGLIDFPQVLPK